MLVAVADAKRRYAIPMDCFGEIIDGCEMDVLGTSYETIDDLVTYCRNVAGSVGRLSLAVFGTDQPEVAVPLADSLGVALQLTNILRDVVEDRSFGRVYLPKRRRSSRELRARPVGSARGDRQARRLRMRPRRTVVLRGP